MPELLWLYLTALLYYRTSVSCMALAEALETVSHDRLTRLLQADWSGHTLLELAARTLFSWEQGCLIIGDTVLAKPFATAIEGPAWVFSSQERKPVYDLSLTRIHHTLEGDQPGMDVLGFHIRQYRVGKHQSGKGPRGYQRLGFNTLITPAKANVKAHLAELGRSIRRGRAWPQAAMIRHLTPKIRGGAHDDRTRVRQATCSRVDHLPWVTLRRWARRRPPNASAGWVGDRYGPRRNARRVFATPAAPQGQGYLTSHREVPRL